jgi:hypothetical protein
MSDAEREHVGDLLQRASGGSTTIVVPEGATVDTDGLRVTMARVKVFTVRRSELGPVHFLIIGRFTMARSASCTAGGGGWAAHRAFQLSWDRTARRF